jgi:hypothetical protein
MSRRRQPRGPELIRNRATQTYTVARNTDLTGIAVALFLAFAALIFAIAPRYFELAPTSVWAFLCFGGAVILWAIGLAGLVYELYLIQGSFAQTDDAWVSASIALFFGLLLIAVHLVAVVALGVTGWIEVVAKLIVIALGFLLALALAATIDDFFIKPRLGRQIPKAKRDARNQLIGNIAAAVLWILTVVSTALSLLDRFFGS